MYMVPYICLVLVVPKELRTKIMKELDNSRISGHLGRDRTLESIRRRIYSYPIKRKSYLRLLKRITT
jgi:hypothetical protein